jgi:Uma2 family endonuclease
MTQTAPTIPLSLEDQPWPEIELPPTDLPYDDGDKMESPWHALSGLLLMACYVAANGGRRDDYYVGVNMFVYYSLRQVRNLDYKGPDFFVVKNVDGTRYRDSWISWVEDSRLPDVIVEFLSHSTEQNDLEEKKRLYEQTFRTAEYFCIAPQVERLIGWRLDRHEYVPIQPDERGWLWSEELGLWIGKWHGTFAAETHSWARFYRSDGTLVRLPDETAQERFQAAQQQAEAAQQQVEAAQQQAEAAQQQAEAERQRAENLVARLAEMEEEIRKLRGAG